MSPSPVGESSAHWQVALGTLTDSKKCLRDVLGRAFRPESSAPDLALIFVSPHFGPALKHMAKQVIEETGCPHVLGCTTDTVIGEQREIETGPALCLALAWLPGAVVQPMSLQFQATPEGGTFVGWPDDMPESWPKESVFLILAEPMSFPPDQLLQRLNEDQPGIPVVGGMASGSWGSPPNRVVLNETEYLEGAVAVLLSGNVQCHPVVSQGCRPVGQPFVITKASRSVIYELGGKPALEQLRNLVDNLCENDKALARHGLCLGRVISEYKDHFEAGDFLIRNLLGMDPQQGFLAVADIVRAGQTVQFHVRDSKSAHDDWMAALSRTKESLNGKDIKGGLLFSCNGRGTRLFGSSDHDAKAIEAVLGPVPVAGMFAAGEIGPVGASNYLHGFTASGLLFQ